MHTRLAIGFSGRKCFLARLSGFLTLILLVALGPLAFGQQTLGSINGTVTDSTGAVIQGAQVKARATATNLEVQATSKSDGSFSIADLPIGAYEVKFIKDGFETDVHPKILVQGNRTATVNAKLKPGSVSSTVTVNSTPLLNETDTTNGYVLSDQLIQSIPLGTGSFTQLAILAPGVNADLLSGSGTNAGLGNQNIWANGQRNTSNSFSFNGIDANNVFNGASSSSVTSPRFILSTGEQINSLSNGVDSITSTSVYNAIGQGMPTPPPETIEELRVNTSMYDASQGAHSGAHISQQQKSGTNQFHGQLWEYHQTDAWNANRFFFNASGIPRPPLHRNTFGGMLGGPIIRSKLFFFGSYQGIRASDNVNSLSFTDVPFGLTSDRSSDGLTALANNLIDPQCGTSGHPACVTPNQLDPVAVTLMQYKLPNGQFLVPNPTITDPTKEVNGTANAVIQGSAARFTADQYTGDIDYDFGAKDRLAAKYYFQRDPNSSPFAASAVQGFTKTLNAGAQVLSLNNTTLLAPNLTWDQRVGFIRQSAYANTAQQISPSSVGINIFGGKTFPGIRIDTADQGTAGSGVGNFNHFLTIGPGGDSATFSNAGVYQNQFEAASNLNWVHGRHLIATGFNWDYNQLNIINHNDQLAKVETFTFSDFLLGNLRPGQEFSVFFNGASNRYYRSKQVGAYVQDNVKVRSNLTINLGVRFDWDGPLSEKYGRLTNFSPPDYKYDQATDTITNIGLVVAGNNRAFGTKGVSPSTLTGRQWGFAPRLGLVWSPSFVKNFVIRTAVGMYYDRGEYFTELSPSAGFGFNGPFGVTLEPPFIVPFTNICATSQCLGLPFGTTPPPPPPQNLSQVQALVRNRAQLTSGCTSATSGFPFNPCFNDPFLFGGYDPANKLPYSENWTLDLQWQPRNDWVIDIAYVGNHGVHQTMPIPFNQPSLASVPHPVHGENYSYGYIPALTDSANNNYYLSTETTNTATGGNTDLRVPYLGYSPNSVFYRAEGISNYHALQSNVTKRLSHGLQLTASYTWSRTLDEQSGLGLFYTGNNPLNPRSGYGPADFDRTHVWTFSYLYQIPSIASPHAFVNAIANGWQVSGITVLESGQPYSIFDFSGTAGGIYYSANDFITNPIVPLAPGFTAQSAQLQGTTGINPTKPLLNVNAFGLPPALAANANGPVPPCETINTVDGPTQFCDTVETGFGTTGRNIFRGPFQARFDFSVAKDFKLNERFHLRYDAQFFNIFNHPSFDVPNNNVTLNPCFNPQPCYTVPAPPSQNLGVLQTTLGSPRFIQMALHLTF